MKNKAALIVLVILTAGFFIFMALMFGSGAQVQAITERKLNVEAGLDAIAESDITIYWIGELPKELEHLSPVVNVIAPENVTRENIPVRGPAFHIEEYTPEGLLVNEEIPREYSAHMMIVITGNPVISDDGKAALLDAISKNGVPVLAIGDEASEVLGEILSYRRFKRGPGSSLYYCLGAGYNENLIPVETVKAGGMDLAEALPDAISLAVSDYIPQN